MTDNTIASPVPVNEFKAGWRPLAASAAGIGLGMSPLPTFTAGAFAVALHAEFGWARGAILLGSAICTGALMVCGPIIGRLTDRYGARPVALVSTLCFGLSMCALSQTTSHIWTFYALYLLMALTSVGTTPLVYSKVVSLWFDRQRGLALGIALCTTGVAAVLLPSYAQAVIDRFGWRAAYVALGLLPLLVALPLIAFLLPRRDAPVSATQPDQAGGRREGAALEGVEVKGALRDYRFWLLAFLILIGGIGLGGVVFNFVPILVDRGFTPAEAAKVFGVYGLAVVIGRLLSGWLLDRFWGPAVGLVFMVIPTFGCLILASGLPATAPIVAAAAMLGLASGAEFDLCAYLTSRYFGRRNFATLYSLQYACFAVGAGTAPAIFGAVRDVSGSYNLAIYAGAGLFALAAVGMPFLGRYPKWVAPTPQPA